MNISIDQAGRIVLPKSIRQELAVKPGDVFKLSMHGTSVTLTPEKTTSGFIRKGKALVFATAGREILTNDAVNSILTESREEREGLGLLSASKKRKA